MFDKNGDSVLRKFICYDTSLPSPRTFMVTTTIFAKSQVVLYGNKTWINYTLQFYIKPGVNHPTT